MPAIQGVVDYFKILKKHSSLGTSYAFVGENLDLVFEIIKTIACEESQDFCDSCWDCQRLKAANHPDLFIVEPEGLSIKIAKIRESIQFLSLKSFRLAKKVVVIKEAQHLTLPAANAFLKTLEEPPKNSFIAVCTSKLEGLLPTINSRCRKIFLPRDEKEAKLLDFDLVSAFLKGRDLEFKDRKQFKAFVWNFILLLRVQLLLKTGFKNKQLPHSFEHEIIFGSKRSDQIELILDELLKIYQASNSVNINLALNLIKMRIG